MAPGENLSPKGMKEQGGAGWSHKFRDLKNLPHGSAKRGGRSADKSQVPGTRCTIVKGECLKRVNGVRLRNHSCT